MKRNASHVWPYIIVGSAVGGTLGYLLGTESGRKMRHCLTHPAEFGETLDDTREVFERNARSVTDKVRTVLGKARASMEAGKRAFEEASEGYRSKFRKIESKNDEIASNVHKAVDNLKGTAYTVEESILDPIYEVSAIYKGIDCGIRTFFGRRGGIREL